MLCSFKQAIFGKGFELLWSILFTFFTVSKLSIAVGLAIVCVKDKQVLAFLFKGVSKVFYYTDKSYISLPLYGHYSRTVEGEQWGR